MATDEMSAPGSGEPKSGPVPYAHTAVRPDGTVDPNRARWQPLEEHLANTARLAAEFLEPCGLADLGRRVGLLHDLGKYSEAFQHRLSGLATTNEYGRDHATERVNHSAAGSLFFLLDDYLRSSQQVMVRPSCALAAAFCIAFHHGGLSDREDLRGRLEEEAQKRRAGRRTLLDEALLGAPPSSILEVPPLRLPPTVTEGDRGASYYRRFEFLVRMVYSALLDADFLDTERHFAPEQASARPESPPEAIGTMRTALDTWLQNEFSATEESGTSDVNRARAAVLSSCRVAAQLAPGLFTLAAPTGTGKTLSSLAFALRHAELHGLRRVVVVIPYTSIIDQTAQTYRRWLATSELPAAWLLEHHSGVSPDRETPESRLASENWDAPLVVTTSVQFFESLHARRSSSVRKLHRLLRSVVVLDEIQTLPPGLLQPCLDSLGHLVKEFGTSVVLATATQPALTEDIPKVGTGLVEGLATVAASRPREIVAEPEAIVKALGTRVRYHWTRDDGGPIELTWEEVADRMLSAPGRRVLAVVNTRSDARALFELVRREDPAARHLSALMCPEHRRDVLGAVRTALKDHQPCLVVSTQLVEAGVDVDFPMVLRALAGLDSIVQAAGRCNREGQLPGPGEVTVFVPKEGGRTSPTVRMGADICAAWLREGDLPDPQQPDQFLRYFREFYGRQNTDEKSIRSLREELAFERVAREFQLIDDDHSEAVLVPYGCWEAAVQRFQGRSRPARERWRLLQPYLVNLRRWDLERREIAGALEEVALGLRRCPSHSPFIEYDDCLGLVLKGAVVVPRDLIS
jgi:CRISPR-associated endonuclease/helicase Cas3